MVFRVHRRLYLVLGLWTAACSSQHPNAGPAPADSIAAAPAPVPTAPLTIRVDTVRVTDPALEQQIDQLEVELLDKSAQVEELQAQLAEARREVVRVMAKLQTLATRAEAASAMAEAELAIQALRNIGGTQADVSQAKQLLDESGVQFNQQNYGGALYMANQAKVSAGVARGRLDESTDRRPGEKVFSAPVKLKSVGRTNVREGPGTSFRILFTVDAEDQLTGFSYTSDWIRVTDNNGRTGWIIRSRVTRPGDEG